MQTTSLKLKGEKILLEVIIKDFENDGKGDLFLLMTTWL